MNFVTGGTGLIGTHLLLELLRRGESVKALRRKSSDLSMVLKVFEFWGDEGKALFDRINWVEGDILDIPSLEEAMNDVDMVYHCAAMVSFHPRDFETMRKVNVEGTANIVNLCLHKGISKLSYISSIAAIGRTESGQHVDETTEWKNSPNNSHYAISKRDAELEIWRGEEEGLKVLAVNPGVIIGPGDIKQSSSKIFDEVKSGLKLYTEGVNGFTDVRDVAEALIELPKKEKWGERYVMVGENLPMREVLNLIADGFDKPRPTQRLSPFLIKLAGNLYALKDLIFRTKSGITRESVRNMDKSYFYDSGKVENALGRPLRPIPPIVEQSCRFFGSPLKS